MIRDPKVLLQALEKSASEEVSNQANQIHTEVFSRTDCLACGNCCKSAPPIVNKQDIKRIAAHLKMPPKTFQRKYVLEDINGELSFDRVPCPFLESDNVCSIYEYRPQACRDYPHTHSAFFKHNNLHIENLEICPAVQEILEIMEMQFLENNP